MPGDTAWQALSVSRPVWELWRKPFTGRVLAHFERACTLQITGGSVISLVDPEVGDGPFNIVVDARTGDWNLLQPGAPVRLEDGLLRVGEVAVALKEAVLWEPRPPWHHLRAQRKTIQKRLASVLGVALSYAPEDSLLALLSERAFTEPTQPGPADRSAEPASNWIASQRAPASSEATLAAVCRAARTLEAGWNGDRAQLRTGVAQLAGLGGGLTPAGDDFLLGLMLWAWLAHPTPGPLCELLLEAAEPRTTTLSAAFLRAAARGECSAPWHRLLTALEQGAGARLTRTVRDVLAHGHTSGADALAGFLWRGTPSTDLAPPCLESNR